MSKFCALPEIHIDDLTNSFHPDLFIEVATINYFVESDTYGTLTYGAFTALDAISFPHVKDSHLAYYPGEKVIPCMIRMQKDGTWCRAPFQYWCVLLNLHRCAIAMERNGETMYPIKVSNGEQPIAALERRTVHCTPHPQEINDGSIFRTLTLPFAY